jgi:hypothetical protein
MSETEKSQGWDSITDVFAKKYPDQKNPLHFGTLLSWKLGGNDPLEGISMYDGGDYYHFVTYGFSELHTKESEDPEYSGYGFELTVKLKKSTKVDEEELKGMAGVLQSLARYVFEESVIFQPYEYIYTGQKSGMDTAGTSNITGFMTVPDEAGVIHTPHGKVEFVQLIGMTDRELKALVDKEYTVQELLSILGDDVTDYNRKELI